MARQTSHWLVASAAVLTFAQGGPVGAQTQKPVVIVVPYAPGGGTDTVARLVGEHMSRALGRTVMVENVAGAGGTVANERVARSTPDGSMVLINHVALLAAPGLYTNLRYDTKTAFETVGLVNVAPLLLIGRKSIPGKTPAELLAWIRQNGSKVNFAHGGLGTNTHLAGVMTGNVMGFKPTFVAYRGSAPAITDLLAGQVDLMWDQVTSGLPQVQAGSLHGIAVTAPQRLDELKDVPTTTELGIPELNYTMWHGFYTAKGTPSATIASLNKALAEAVANPTVVTRFKQLGTTPFPQNQRSAEAHKQLFDADLLRVAKLVESSGAKPTEAK